MYEPFEELKRAERQEGRLEGRIEGRIEGRLEAITNLMANQQISIVNALETLGIPEVEWDVYIEKVGNKAEHMIA